MMKRIITTAIAAAGFYAAHAQFTLLTPDAAVSSVRDISAGKEGQVLFATDNGTMVYNAGAWQQITPMTYITSLTTYSNGFLFGSIGQVIGKSDYVDVVTDTFTLPAFSYIAGSCINNTGDTLRVSDNDYVFITNAAGTGYLDLNAGLSTPLGTPVGMEHIYLPGLLDLYVMATSNKTVFYDMVASGEVILDETSGLPSNTCYSQTLDSATYYVGTDAGLATAYFGDGLASVTGYYFNRANTPEIPSDSITAVAAKDDDIFVGTPKGMAIRKDGVWTRYTTENSNLPEDDIVALEYLQDSGDLYGATRSGKLFKTSATELSVGRAAAHAAELRIKAYPNPATDKIQFAVSGLTEGTVAVRNAAGQQVALLSLQEAAAGLQTSQLPGGLYLYTVYSRGRAAGSGRFTVAH